MPNRPLKPCLKMGCNNLTKSGYCDAHSHIQKQRIKEAFGLLDRKKTPESKAFYASRRWIKCSIEYRRIEPLCRRCKAKGIIKAAQMVHHNPEVKTLLEQGLRPYDHQYLESLCNDCHLGELRARRQGKREVVLYGV